MFTRKILEVNELEQTQENLESEQYVYLEEVREALKLNISLKVTCNPKLRKANDS